MYEARVGRRLGICIYLIVDIFKQTSLFAANNSFDLGKQSSQKSWTKLLKLLAKIHVNEFIFKVFNFTKKHDEAYPRIIQAYSGIFRDPCNPEIFRTVVHPEPWHIHNTGIFRTPVYSERWHIQKPRHIQNDFKHLWWSVLRN